MQKTLSPKEAAAKAEELEKLQTEAAEHGFIKSRGVRFPKDPKFIHGRLRRSLRTNNHESKEAECVLRTVRNDDVVLELGSGIGFMSSFVATKRYVRSVDTFEANPALIPYIRKVHAANDLSNVTLHHGILGDKEGTTPFYARENILASSLSPLPEEDDKTPPQICDVPVFDSAKVMREIKPTVLICDIEGAEVDLLPTLDLSGLRAAIIETHPQWMGPTEINRLFQAFMDAGLAYYHRGSINKVVTFRNRW